MGSGVQVHVSDLTGRAKAEEEQCSKQSTPIYYFMLYFIIICFVLLYFILFYFIVLYLFCTLVLNSRQWTSVVAMNPPSYTPALEPITQWDSIASIRQLKPNWAVCERNLVERVVCVENYNIHYCDIRVIPGLLKPWTQTLEQAQPIGELLIVCYWLYVWNC